MKRQTRVGFIVLWVVVAVITTALAWLWTNETEFMGIVETRNHKLGAREPGRVRQVLVRLGDEVEPGQLLAVLDTSDLEHEREWLKDEIKRRKSALKSDKVRYAVEIERLRLQGDARSSELIERRAEIAEKRGELEVLDRRIAELKAAQSAGLGRSRDLDELLLRRNGTARYLRAMSNAPKDANNSDSLGLDNAQVDDVVASMIAQELNEISEFELRLKTVEDRLDLRRIVSPCRGHVVKVSALPGDVVDEFIPLMSVEETSATYLDGYIPEKSDYLPQLGQRVVIVPHRTGAENCNGTIVFIDPGYSAIPERLTFRNMIYWARKFRVKLDDGHNLLPGEAAKVEVLAELIDVLPAMAKGTKDTQVGEEDTAAKHVDMAPNGAKTDGDVEQKTDNDEMFEFLVPQTLLRQSKFEPSGMVWLPDIKRFLIASDDTSRGKPQHAPWLYLADINGRVEPDPVIVNGAEALNDIEAIAIGPDQELYLVASQSLSRKNKRPASRRQIFEVERNGRTMKVTGSVDFVDILSRSLSADGRRALGLDGDDPDLKTLEIEGATYLNKTLVLGLKSPRLEAGALLWNLKNPDRLFKENTLYKDQLVLLGTVDLRTTDGRPSAFSDLAFDSDGELWATATVPNDDGAPQEGGLFRLTGISSGGPTVAERIRTFANKKPEGLCMDSDGRIMIAFDTNDEQPFSLLRMERTKP